MHLGCRIVQHIKMNIVALYLGEADAGILYNLRNLTKVFARRQQELLVR